MKVSELMALYQSACRGMRQDPEPAEFEIWKSVLGSYDVIDVQIALQDWWASENGKFLPKPADLKPLAEANSRIRQKVSAPDFCKDSAVGLVMKLVEGKLKRVRCECIECVRTREWSLAARSRG